MGEIKTVKCKHCGTEWRMSIGPVMSTPLDSVFTYKCEDCGKEVKMSLEEHLNGRFECECGGLFEFVANEEDRHCPKCGGEEYETEEVIMVD